MNDYIIVTDSSCDLPESLVEELGIKVIKLDFIIEGEEAQNNDAMDAKHFYRILRTGKMITTSAVSIDRFLNEVEPYLEAGKDVLYLGFSSGLSGTYNAGAVAAGELSEKYPLAKIYTVDTLAASMGQGLLVWYAANMKKDGKSIEEVRDFVENNKMSLAHWFTVNDLFFLKRGGRVSAATAVVGSMLAIKPLLHVDNEGHLISIGKARGRKGALDGLIKAIENSVVSPETQTMFISHGDCEDEANAVAEMMKEKFNPVDVKVGCIGPVIGAHSGPGTIAVFFLGSER